VRRDRSGGRGWAVAGLGSGVVHRHREKKLVLVVRTGSSGGKWKLGQALFRLFARSFYPLDPLDPLGLGIPRLNQAAKQPGRARQRLGGPYMNFGSS